MTHPSVYIPELLSRCQLIVKWIWSFASEIRYTCPIELAVETTLKVSTSQVNYYSLGWNVAMQPCWFFFSGYSITSQYYQSEARPADCLQDLDSIFYDFRYPSLSSINLFGIFALSVKLLWFDSHGGHTKLGHVTLLIITSCLGSLVMMMKSS